MLDETRSLLDGVIGAVAFWASAADVLTRFARTPWLADEDARRLHFVAYAGLRLGEEVLRAETEEDHLDRILRASNSMDLLRLSALGFRSMQCAGDSTFSNPPALPALAEVFGRGAIPRLEEGDKHAFFILQALHRRCHHIQGLDVHVQHEDMFSFLVSPTTPAEVFHAVRGGLEAATCFAGMALAVVTHREVRPKIAATLADRWTRGQASFWRLIASMPGVTVGPSLVPAEGLLDLERLFAEAAANPRPPQPVPPEIMRALLMRAADPWTSLAVPDPASP